MKRQTSTLCQIAMAVCAVVALSISASAATEKALVLVTPYKFPAASAINSPTGYFPRAKV